MATNLSAYKSEKSKAAALCAYNKLLTQWPVSYSEMVVDTSFGQTYLIVSGKEEAPPLIFLHGGGGNSTMWMHNIAGLTEHFRIYCLDIIGEPGKSTPNRPSFKGTGYAEWLKETLDHLGLKSVALCAASLGCVIAHKFALEYPEYVNSLVLIGPPTLMKFRMSFIFRAILANVIPANYFTIKFLQAISAANYSENELNTFITQFKAYNPNKEAVMLPVIPAKDLTELKPKTLILMGEKEALYDPEDAAKHVNGVAPKITVKLIPKAKHTVSIDQPEQCNQELIDFCS